MKKKILLICTTDSMIWNFLIPHIKLLEHLGYVVECACSKTGFYYSELEDTGIILHKISFTRNPVSINNVNALFQIKHLIIKDHFDFVYCHEPVGGMIGRLVGKICKIKVIYMSHGFHFFTGAPLRHWLLYYTAEWLLSFITDVCITINKEDYERACNLHAKKNYYVHGIGLQSEKRHINQNREVIRKKLGFLTDDVVMIAIGEFSIRKNHQLILSAMRYINDIDNKRFRLILCGDGILKEKLMRLASKYGIGNSVKFTGFVRNVADYLNASDFMLLPSLWEGLGLVGLEALQMGKPVVGSRIQGIKDYVIDGETGYLFEPKNMKDIVEKIKKLTDKNFLKNNVEKMHNLAKKYTLKSVIKEFIHIYRAEFTVNY